MLCNFCNQEINNQYCVCPHCGMGVEPKKNKNKIIVKIIISILFIVYLIFLLNPDRYFLNDEKENFTIGEIKKAEKYFYNIKNINDYFIGDTFAIFYNGLYIKNNNILALNRLKDIQNKYYYFLTDINCENNTLITLYSYTENNNKLKISDKFLKTNKLDVINVKENSNEYNLAIINCTLFNKHTMANQKYSKMTRIKFNPKTK